MQVISIDNQLRIPKYKQIVKSIESGIIEGVLRKGDALPSINGLRDQFGISRDTVLMAFNELKTRGIAESIAGKGYFIKSEQVNVTEKIFMLFDEFNSFKEDIYNSFREAMSINTQVDIYFHHFNYDLFKKLIYDNIGDYSAYILMPVNFKKTHQVIEKLPKDKVYILDQMQEELKHYAGVYQNFETDMFLSLQKLLPNLRKYQSLVLLFAEAHQPIGMMKGFQRFSELNEVECQVITNSSDLNLKKGVAYLVLEDHHLIMLLKAAKERKWAIGKDLGIISYNETLLKEVLADGITTISTNFYEMGSKLAEMIGHKKWNHIENKSMLKIRNSL